jgi:hypothetical protein
MKTIDTKSLLLGVLATVLVLTLTSSKSSEEKNDNFEFLSLPLSVGIYNKTTKTIYLYTTNSQGKGMDENPSRIYKVAEDGSSVTKK